jgi:UDP-2-acetamido-3-amino-2,3-dideoxy-glucuronate N-acetyltransferase
MNPQQSPKDLALIGAGYWGKNLARDFNALGVLHTICDQHQGTLDAFAAGYESVEKTVKLDPVLRSDSITKVAIAAPAALHYNLVKQSLEAGKDVFVEKPLCLNTAETGR